MVDGRMSMTSGTKKGPNHRGALCIIFLILIGFLVVFIVYLIESPESFAIANNEALEWTKHGTPNLDCNGNQLVRRINNPINGFYYWAATTSTVGYGDICPVSTNAKALTSVYQIFLIICSLGLMKYVTDTRFKRIIESMRASASSTVDTDVK